jgi:hypothetical protein
VRDSKLVDAIGKATLRKLLGNREASVGRTVFQDPRRHQPTQSSRVLLKSKQRTRLDLVVTICELDLHSRRSPSRCYAVKGIAEVFTTGVRV